MDSINKKTLSVGIVAVVLVYLIVGSVLTYRSEGRTQFVPNGLVIFLVTLPQYFIPNGFDESAYTISYVSPVNVYDSDVFSRNFWSSRGAALATVLSYWGRDNEDFYSSFSFLEGDRLLPLSRAAAGLGFSARTKQFTKIAELQEYINADAKTPLIVYNSYSNTFPRFLTAKVIIGISPKRKEIEFHDFFRGNNVIMKFRDFQALWPEHWIEEDKNKYLVVKPRDLEKALDGLLAREVLNPEEFESYPARLEIMDALEPIWGALFSSTLEENSAEQKRLLQEAISDTAFQSLHPATQVYYISVLARIFMLESDLESAQKVLEIALDLNQGLNGSFPPWGNLAITESPAVFIALGEFQALLGNVVRAEEYFAQAREIQ